MKQKEFEKYLARDGGCYHCGEKERVAPHHRANRGMGGSKKRDVPSNIVVICSHANHLMEANADFAELAYSKGWKLRISSSPSDIPIYDAQTGCWFFLRDDFTRHEL